jgi:hypothetical protein
MANCLSLVVAYDARESAEGGGWGRGVGVGANSLSSRWACEGVSSLMAHQLQNGWG